MDSLIKKRKRTENWSTNDKNLLKSLCVENISTIENKSVDTNTNKKKKECWMQIKNQFNSASDVSREVSQVVLQWKNMKLRVKAAESAYRRAKNQTGGGPPPKSPSKEDQELIDLMPNEFEIDFNEFDSNGATLQNPKTEDNAIIYEDIEIINDESYYSEKENQQDEIYVDVEQAKPSTKKGATKRKMVNNSDSSYKKEIFELTRDNMKTEHEEKIKLLKLEQLCREEELKNLKMQGEMIKQKMYI